MLNSQHQRMSQCIGPCDITSSLTFYVLLILQSGWFLMLLTHAKHSLPSRMPLFSGRGCLVVGEGLGRAAPVIEDLDGQHVLSNVVRISALLTRFTSKKNACRRLRPTRTLCL